MLSRVSSMRRRAPRRRANGVALLPRAAPGAEVMPFEDSAFVEGVCLFDLSRGLMRVRADADPENLLALSFHARTGRIFHSVTDRSAIKGKIDVLIGDASQIEAVEGEDEEGAAAASAGDGAVDARLRAAALAGQTRQRPRPRRAAPAFRHLARPSPSRRADWPEGRLSSSCALAIGQVAALRAPSPVTMS